MKEAVARRKGGFGKKTSSNSKKVRRDAEQKQKLQNEIDKLANKLGELEKDKNAELEKNKQLVSELTAEKDQKIKELQINNDLLSERIKELEQSLKELQKSIEDGAS